MEKLKNYIIIGVLIAIILLLGWGVLNMRGELKNYQNQISKFELGEQEYITKLDAQGRELNEQSQVILTKDQAIKHGLLEIDRLKKVQSQVKVITRTQVDSILIPFIDSVDKHILVVDSINYLPIPKSFSLTDKWYSFDGVINKQGILMDSISFVNDIRITLGYKKQPFIKDLFSKPIPIVDVLNQNPYTEVTGLQNVVIEERKKFYHKKGFWAGVGFVGGIFVATQLK